MKVAVPPASAWIVAEGRTVARQNEVFEIDGDTALKARAKPALRETVSGPAVTLAEARPAPTTATRQGSARAAGAASLSLWVWGTGQWVNRDRDLAALLFLWQIQIVAVHYLVASTWGSIRRMAHIFFVSEWELLLYAAALDFWLIFLFLFNVSQAYRSAERSKGPFRGLMRPWLSGLASVLVPGWGQLLNGQLRKGLFFLFAFVTQVWVMTYYLLTPLYRLASDLDPNQLVLRNVIQAGKAVLGITAVLWLLSAYDAVLVSRYTRNREI
jgi:hypothetical protein